MIPSTVTWLFLHCLEQRGLSLRRCTIDLVSENEVGEDRSRAEGQLAAALVEDPRTRDVRGHQVGRELDPRRLEAEHPGEGAHDEGLGEPGHVLEQHVATGEHAYQDEPMASRLPTTARSTSATTSWRLRATSAVGERRFRRVRAVRSPLGSERLEPVDEAVDPLDRDAWFETIRRRRTARVHQRVPVGPRSSTARSRSDSETP